MDWLIGSKQGEAKKRIAQLADATKRERAAQDLIRIGADAVPSLIEALQTKDENLLPLLSADPRPHPLRHPHTDQDSARSPSHPAWACCRNFRHKQRSRRHPRFIRRVAGRILYRPFTCSTGTWENWRYEKRSRPLLIALKDKEDEVRSAACLALGLFGIHATFDEITNVLLDDPKIEVRQAAARALGNTQHPAALPYLMEALHDSFWWYEREYAAGDLLSAIEKMNDVAVDPLIEALGDKEGTVRKFAAILLGKLGDPRAIEPLGMTLYDMHHDVGNASAESLAKFGAPAVGVLIEALSHPEMWIRIHSVLALSKIKDARVAPDIIADAERPGARGEKAGHPVIGGIERSANIACSSGNRIQPRGQGAAYTGKRSDR